MIRGRLAPSPTGAQHLGNARTYLIAFWAARSVDGEIVLRIDDLDSPRVKSWASEQAIEDLRWLGLRWDGEVAYQTQCTEAYSEALQTLIRTDRVYPCTCSRKDIEQALSAPHESRFRGEGAVYPGTCSHWHHGAPIPEIPFCWRFRASNETLSFEDENLGEQSCNPAVELGDFPITQKTGQSAYQLAVCVDDMTAEVTQVVRGNDLIASTFRQMQIYRALDETAPTYAHVPLVRGMDDRRLAKRHGDTRLSVYRQSGVAPEAIVGWAAYSLGLLEKPEPCSATEMIEEFDWDRIGSQDTRIDPESIFFT
ncbi:MAG: glutamate--tRNA ligase family protein [Planctomycetota bacterium]